MYHLLLVTPSQIIFDGDVHSLIAPGAAGYFEILTNHASIIALLKTGKLTVTDKEMKKWVWAVSGGCFEMLHNKATLLADAAELASEIDVKRAEKALRKAQDRLNSHGKEIEIERVKEALDRAKNRIKVSQSQK